MEPTKIYLIQTDICCFISDCKIFSGYNYNYHTSSLAKLFFDGSTPEPTFIKHWWKIKKYPQKIEISQSQPNINKRYEIRDETLISKQLPKIINLEEKNNYTEAVLNLYDFKSDKVPNIMIKGEYDIETIFKVDNYQESPKFDYNILLKNKSKISNVDINHQLLDKLIFPEILLSVQPCSISSLNLYGAIRKHIIDNIDARVSTITSNYDFCFTVKKIVPLIKPRKFTYNNIFARTKKARLKTHFGIQEYKNIEIFEMTNDKENYNNYTPVKTLFAENEIELKDKIDTLLKNLITVINEPLSFCTHCNGTGYTQEIKTVKIGE